MPKSSQIILDREDSRGLTGRLAQVQVPKTQSIIKRLEISTQVDIYATYAYVRHMLPTDVMYHNLQYPFNIRLFLYYMVLYYIILYYIILYYIILYYIIL